MWIYRNKEFTDPDPKFYGFVYLITNLKTGRMYVGRKYFTLKRGSKRVESDWRTYWGSCKPLLDDIDTIGIEHFRRDILECYTLRGQVNYHEVKEQFARDVLKATFRDGTRMYYNNNIMTRWYASRETHSEETKQKISKSMMGQQCALGRIAGEAEKTKRRIIMRGNSYAKGSIRTPEMREKYSKAKSGVPLSDAHKKKLALANVGKLRSEKSKQKHSNSMSKLKWWTDGSKNKRCAECPEGWRPGRINKSHVKLS